MSVRRTLAPWTAGAGCLLFAGVLPACGARTAIGAEIAGDAGSGAVAEAGGDDAPPPPSGLGVLFGGSGYPGGPLNDTWTWDGSAWTKLDVAGPPARYGAAAATLEGTIVLFGGMGEEMTTLSDTWTWDGARWTKLDVTGPPARYGSLMVSLGDRLVLVGGYGSYLTDILTDTWIWDGSVWAQVDTTGPSPKRGGFSLAPLGDTVLLYGGEQLPNGYLSDTWTFDGTVWTQLVVSGPPAREGAAMATIAGEAILVGGYDDGYDADASAPFSDTWAWNGMSWAQLSVPSPPDTSSGGRESPAMTNVKGELVLFGGGTYDASPWYSDTWAFDGSSWTKLDVTGPSARRGAAMATR
jgi:hypothetical protein